MSMILKSWILVPAESMKASLVLWMLLFLPTHLVLAQPPQAGEWEAMRSIVPEGYVCYPAKSEIAIDGKLSDSSWDDAPWTKTFVDIQGSKKPKPTWNTQAKLLWDENYLYIAAELEEPHLQATITQHDAVIFQDNDFEIFIDPNGDNHHYAELELNALNTTWDLYLPKPYKDGGSADNSFEIHGLRSAVALNGTLNDPSDEDKGWTLEIAIPWSGLAPLISEGKRPSIGDTWRMGFSRVEWQWEVLEGKYVKKPKTPEDNWIWSAQGIVDMHRPERWGFVRFEGSPKSPSAVANSSSEPFQHGAVLAIRDVLMEVYHRQRVFHGIHDKFAADWDALGWKPAEMPDVRWMPILMQPEGGYVASLESNETGHGVSASQQAGKSGRHTVWSISNESRLTSTDWNDSIISALERAAENRAELERFLRCAPVEQQDAARFLVENMPDRDLKSLTADFLLTDMRVAHEAVNLAPWKDQIPRDIFLNNILPYANINERRDAWRADFRQRFAPLIAEAKTPSQAAALLNQRLFPLVKVKYSTKRAKADQNPYESIESGLASCTGLSVLLIDACRSLGIPARFVGTPLWSDNSGNHSWIEVWDDGWHFTGAAEPSGDQLDQAWFIGRAATAKRDDLRHAIYAVSFQKTPITFPLVWDRRIDYIHAVNVTDRYTKFGNAIPKDSSMISFRIQDGSKGERVSGTVVVRDANGAELFRGMTNDERFDANDHLHCYLPIGKEVVAEMEYAEQKHSSRWKVSDKSQLISWLPTRSSESADAANKNRPAVPNSGSDAAKDEDPIESLSAYLKLSPEARGKLAEQDFATKALSKEQSEQAQKILADDHLRRIRESRKKELEEKVLVLGDLKMPFTYQVFGEKPATGRSLVFSMHGGGGAPKRVNDQQWENQKKLYRLDEGVYVAPRAPTDTWDLWHQGHIDAFFDRMIENMIALEDVNPDRVYIMGYSAGGDGVYQLAPRMSDRLAAAAMMAGHPNETSPLGLRNLPFTLHMGAKDAAFRRNAVAEEWGKQLDELESQDPGAYIHLVKLHEGKGHWMDRQDAEALPWMFKFNRNRYPNKLVWKQDDVFGKRFYWLAMEKENAKDRALVVATREGQKISIDTSDATAMELRLSDAMLDLSKEVVVVWNGKQVFQGIVPRTIEGLYETMEERGDPTGMFPGSLAVRLPE